VTSPTAFEVPALLAIRANLESLGHFVVGTVFLPDGGHLAEWLRLSLGPRAPTTTTVLGASNPAFSNITVGLQPQRKKKEEKKPALL